MGIGRFALETSALKALLYTAAGIGLFFACLFYTRKSGLLWKRRRRRNPVFRLETDVLVTHGGKMIGLLAIVAFASLSADALKVQAGPGLWHKREERQESACVFLNARGRYVAVREGSVYQAKGDALFRIEGGDERTERFLCSVAPQGGQAFWEEMPGERIVRQEQWMGKGTVEVRIRSMTGKNRNWEQVYRLSFDKTEAFSEPEKPGKTPSLAALGLFHGGFSFLDIDLAV